MTKSILRIIFFRVIGLVVFLILLAVANILIQYMPIKFYAEIVNFFNENLLLLVLLMFIGLINELFWSFYFPFNIIAPISGAVLGIYIVMFLYKFWNFINGYIHSDIVVPINSIYVFIASLTLIIGYIVLLVRHGKPKDISDAEWKKWCEERLKRKKEKLEKRIEHIDEKLGKKKIEWHDIGSEFKLFFYNIGNALNKLFDRDKKKNRRK